MNLSHLHYFVTLADDGHFAHASKTLSIARSTLSLAISQLERELEAPLFAKNGSSFSLTPYGEEFYRYASLALQNIATGKRNVAAMVANEAVTLRVGVPFAMQDENWARLIRSFRALTNPAVSVIVVQKFSAELLHELAAGNLDVTFAAQVADHPDGLVFTPYWSQQLVVAVNRENPLASRTSLSFDDLTGLSVYSYAKDCPPHDRIQGYVDRYGLSVQPLFRDEITICSLVAADEEAVAFVDYSFLVKVFEDVVCIPLEGVPTDFHKIDLVRRDEPLSNAQQRFIDYALAHPIPPSIMPARG